MFKRLFSGKAADIIKIVLIAAFMFAVGTGVWDAVNPKLIVARGAGAEKGVMSLDGTSGFDYKKDLFVLNGEWEYYPGKLLFPADFEGKGPAFVRYIEFPHFWRGNDVRFPNGTGFATYRLVVGKPYEISDAGIYTRFQYGACRIYLNGTFVFGAGNIDENEDNYYFEHKVGAGYLPPSAGDSYEIIVQVQSYDYYDAGLVNQIIMGSSEAVASYDKYLLMFSGITAGAILVLICYFIILFIRNTKRKEYLNFTVVSIFCLFSAMLANGGNIIDYLSSKVGGEWIGKFEFISLFIIAFFATAHILKKHAGFLYIDKIALIYTILGCLFVSALNPYRISQLRLLLFILSMAVMVAALAINIIGTVKGRGANRIRRLEFIGLLVLIGGVVSRMIGFALWESFVMFPVFAVIYCFMQIFVLAEHYREVEKNMAKLAKTLEHRVAERTTALVELNKKMQMANDAKGDFLARVSHEIRTPVNGIISKSDMIEAGKLSEQQKTCVKYIKENSSSLLQTINDILDFSKIESGKMELVPAHFNLRTLIDDICSVGRVSARQKYLGFESEVEEGLPSTLFADEIRIKQVVANVISNAVKYTDDGGVILQVSAAEMENEGYLENVLLFTVSDTGIGIREEDMPHLFDTFTQLDAVKRRGIIGTGLGLAICRQLMKMLGGKIEIESVFGKGSIFKLYFPYVEGEESLVRNVKVNEKIYAKNAKVLVVDDNKINLAVALGFLTSHDITPDTAADGYEAIRMVSENEYDLIFMDQFMPGIDGLETTQSIRALGGRNTAVPIVAMTAYLDAGVKEMMMFKGMSDYIPKPINHNMLNDILIRWLPNSKISSALGRFDKKADEESLGEIPRELVGIAELNCGAALKNLDGNTGIYMNLLRRFSEETDDYEKSLEECLENADMKNYRIIIHGIKNTLYDIGAKTCGDLAYKLEKASAEGDGDFCREKNGAFFENIQWISNRIALALPDKTLSSSRKREGDLNYLADIIHELAYSFSIGDCDSIDARTAVLKEYLFGGKYDLLVSEIIKESEIMEYEAAAEICADIIHSLVETAE